MDFQKTPEMFYYILIISYMENVYALLFLYVWLCCYYVSFSIDIVKDIKEKFLVKEQLQKYFLCK